MGPIVLTSLDPSPFQGFQATNICPTCYCLDLYHRNILLLAPDLTNSKDLQLFSCRITDLGVSYLRGLSKLTQLYLESCPVTASCLEDISGDGLSTKWECRLLLSSVLGWAREDLPWVDKSALIPVFFGSVQQYVKRQLLEVSNKDMPENFCWSYNRKCWLGTVRTSPVIILPALFRFGSSIVYRLTHIYPHGPTLVRS
ncbi:hypothetical protein ACQ4PT_036416 [Festuca glaucescens]